MRTALGELESRVGETEGLAETYNTSIAAANDSSSSLLYPSSTTTNVPLQQHTSSQDFLDSGHPTRYPPDLTRSAIDPGEKNASDERIASTTSVATSVTPRKVSSDDASSGDVRLEDIELMIDSDYSGILRPTVEKAIKKKWSRIIGQEFDVVVSS